MSNINYLVAFLLKSTFPYVLNFKLSMTSTNLKGMFNISFTKSKVLREMQNHPSDSVFSLEAYSITETYSTLPERMPKSEKSSHAEPTFHINNQRINPHAFNQI